MTEREYRQDDRTEGYCPQCGEPLSAMTTDTRGFCEIHGWTWADWKPGGYRRFKESERLAAHPSDRDPGDETDEETRP